MELEMTLEAFAHAVKERARRGESFLRALYSVLDAYQAFEHRATDVRPACEKSCSGCCYQMVCVYPQEMDTIWQFLEQKPGHEKRQLREQIHRAVEEWRAYRARKQFSRKLHDPIALAGDFLGKPCPFLMPDGACGIYEARPMPCRTTTSPIRCSTLAHQRDGEHARQMRYQSEEWANHLLMEYAKHEPGVTPLQAFLATKRRW